MKYLVAVKYLDSETYKIESEVFEFKKEKDREEFINEVKPIVREIALSQVEEKEWRLFIFVEE